MNLDIVDELDIEEAVKQYYDWAVENYEMMYGTINENDFEFLKDQLQFEEGETYEKYCQEIEERIKPEEETKQEIREFLQEYPEFKKSIYLTMLRYINDQYYQKRDQLKQQFAQEVLPDVINYESGGEDEEEESENSEDIEEEYFDDENGDSEMNPQLKMLYYLLFRSFNELNNPQFLAGEEVGGCGGLGMM